jgi:hypothetical protein
MRGGGAGSWGVIVNATFQMYPTFNASVSAINITTKDLTTLGNVVTAHAKHIFDWDSLRASQYYFVANDLPEPSMTLTTFFTLGSVTDATNAMQPFINDIKALGANITTDPVVSFSINSLVGSDDVAGGYVVFGSRLIPASIFRQSPELVSATSVELLKGGDLCIMIG